MTDKTSAGSSKQKLSALAIEFLEEKRPFLGDNARLAVEQFAQWVDSGVSAEAPQPAPKERSLLERLRRPKWVTIPDQDLMNEAADEMERLERELRLSESARDYANDILSRARAAPETPAQPVFNHERDCGLTNDAGTCECPQSAEDLKKRIDFAASALGVVERRRDELKAERDHFRATLERVCAVDKAAPGRRDCDIWAEMLAEAADALRPAQETPEQQPVAWRYRDSRGHWRYCGNKPAAYACDLLKPEPLFVGNPPKAATETEILSRTGAYAPEATCKHGVHPYDCQQGCDPNRMCELCNRTAVVSIKLCDYHRSTATVEVPTVHAGGENIDQIHEGRRTDCPRCTLKANEKANAGYRDPNAYICLVHKYHGAVPCLQCRALNGNLSQE